MYLGNTVRMRIWESEGQDGRFQQEVDPSGVWIMQWIGSIEPWKKLPATPSEKPAFEVLPLRRH